jgi:hypothetical protein
MSRPRSLTSDSSIDALRYHLIRLFRNFRISPINACFRLCQLNEGGAKFGVETRTRASSAGTHHRLPREEGRARRGRRIGVRQHIAVSRETRMTHATRFVAAVAVLIVLVLCAPVQAQTPEIDALRVRAEAGDATAQYFLGAIYSNGLGVPEDDAEAVRWYRLAAGQGIATAQFNLGLLYDTGQGVPQDYVQAHMWFNILASRNASSMRRIGVEKRDILAAKMTAEQIAEAQRLARAWDAAHPREP